MKKVLIGVGIGCGALLLLAIIAVVAGGFWVKGKVEGMAQGTEQMQQQEKRVAELNKQYSFQAPPKGQPLQLSEERLKEYLAIRTALKPVFAQYEAKAKEFEQPEGQRPDLSKGMEALGMMMNMMADVRARWIEELERKQMSPREFHAITAAIYSSGWNQAMGDWKKNERAMYEQLKAQFDSQAQDESLPEEAREMAREQSEEMEQKLATLPPAGETPPEVKKIHEANAAITAKYKEQITQDANPGLDAFLVGGGHELGSAFQDAMGDEMPMNEGSER